MYGSMGIPASIMTTTSSCYCDTKESENSFKRRKLFNNIVMSPVIPVVNSEE